jgi:thiamine pyrophosphokinase
MKVGIGATVSLVPFSSRAHIMRTKGLFYPLNEENIFKKSTRGISNAAVEDEVEISVSEGEVLVFVMSD